MRNLELPYPPSINHYWLRASGGGNFISKRGREFRQEVEGIYLERGKTPHHGLLTVELLLFPPDKRRRDIDNVIKPLLDALQHAGAYEDDQQVNRLLVQRCSVVEGGATLVHIEPWVSSDWDLI